MGYRQATAKSYPEEDIQKAIISWKNKEFRLIRAIAIHFEVPVQTLYDRMTGRKPKTLAYAEAQILLNVEEKILE